MKRAILFFICAASAFAAGSVQQTLSQLGSTNTWVLAFRWTGDAVTGAVPVTYAQLQNCCQGYQITQVETVPGSTAPTSGYSVAVNDGAGVDVLGGAGASLSATSSQSFATPISTPPLQGSFSLNITGQSAASATGAVFVFLSKPGTINLAQIGKLPPFPYVLDSQFSSLQTACASALALGRTLILSQLDRVATGQTLACNMYGLTGGKIQPASGQTVTLSGSFDGDLTQHFDLSAGGTVSITGTASDFPAQWTGAACSGGSVNDVVAIQNIINIAGNRNVTLAGKNGSPCGIGSPGLILYPTNGGVGKNSGITLSGQSVYQNYNGAGGGLIAYAANPPESILTVYAQNVNLQNLFIDCNSTAATYGLVSVFGLNSIWNNVATRNCSSDGARIDMFYTPSVNIASGGSAGSSAITLASVTNNGICTFGNSSTAQTCAAIVFGYGTANQESFSISSVAGNVVTISGTLAHNQTVARAQGNNNTMRITGYQSYSNGGWGFHEVFGNDNNKIVMAYPSSKGNALGGELWENGSPQHYGGNYEGDTGPAVQLGTTGGSSGTAFGFFGPLGDVEETTASGGINAIVSVCDNQSQVNFADPSQLIIKSGSSACPTYPTGTATIGYGQGFDQNSFPSFVTESAFGLSYSTTYSSNPSGRCKYPGQRIIVPSGSSPASTFQQCQETTRTSVSNTTNASPAVLTTSIAPTTGYVYVWGYTGACTALNGSWTGTNLTSTTFSIPVNSASLGPCTGSPTVSVPNWSNANYSGFYDVQMSQLTGTDGLTLNRNDNTGGGADNYVIKLNGLDSTSASVADAQLGSCILANTSGSFVGCLVGYTYISGVKTQVFKTNASGAFVIKPPTSCSGLASGTLYNNAGTPGICP